MINVHVTRIHIVNKTQTIIMYNYLIIILQKKNMLLDNNNE